MVYINIWAPSIRTKSGNEEKKIKTMAGQDNNKPNDDSTVTNNQINPSNENEQVNICEEYDFLDMKLDELNSALDFLEQKNDDIHERLKELLQSNRNIRQELQQEQASIAEPNNK